MAVQAQDAAGAKWGLGQRVDGATEAAIDRLIDAGAIVRTHVLRPTWHFVAPDDLRWLVALSGPRVQRSLAHLGRYLDVDRSLVDRAMDVFRMTLAGGRTATRDDLRAALAGAGIDARSGRLGYLIMQAELEAVVCSGPRRGPRHTYALVAERIPPSRERTEEEALAELALRYVGGHGPARDIDLAWWAGLTLGDARRGLAAAVPGVRPERLGERTFWVGEPVVAEPDVGPTRRVGAGTATEPSIRLLPGYDELLVAFRDRSEAFDATQAGKVLTAQELLAPVLVRDGLVVGSWRPTRLANGGLRLEVSALVDLGVGGRAALRAEIAAYETFLGRAVEVDGPD